jgi:hypothetical protein
VFETNGAPANTRLAQNRGGRRQSTEREVQRSSAGAGQNGWATAKGETTNGIQRGVTIATSSSGSGKTAVQGATQGDRSNTLLLRCSHTDSYASPRSDAQARAQLRRKAQGVKALLQATGTAVVRVSFSLSRYGLKKGGKGMFPRGWQQQSRQQL